MLGLILTFLPVGVVSSRQSMEEFRQQRQTEIERVREEREEGIEEIRQAYEDFYAQRRAAFEEFVEEMEQRWGEGNVRVPDRTNYVAYNDARDRRHSVDFEGGNVEVEALVEPDSERSVEEQIKEQIIELVTDSGRDIIEEEIEEDPELEVHRDEQPVLVGQLETKDGEPVDESNAEQFADEIIEENGITSQTVDSEKNGPRQAVSIDFSLIPDHLVERVTQHADRIVSFAQQRDITPSLVFAIIHTESHFNPQARSWIPAYGLMQIVPQTAGKDAYNHLNGEYKLLGPDILYDPAQNIELGTAYIDLLLERYLSPISNPENRLYCAIASYNTGAGNMSRAFVDSMSVSEAAQVINRLSPQQVFDRLKRDLPYEETRNYMIKVTENQELYRQWDT